MPRHVWITITLILLVALAGVLRQTERKRRMLRKVRGLVFILGFITSACGMYYVPKPSVSRPPAVTVGNTPEAQACLRTCMQTHEICRGNCRRSYTQYNGREVEQETQQCVSSCDDSRDACLKTCPP